MLPCSDWPSWGTGIRSRREAYFEHMILHIGKDAMNMEKQDKPIQNPRRSIREWVGDSVKDYSEIQRRFLKIPLNDYCCYLETIFRDERGQELYEDIQKYTDADGDTDMNHVLRMLSSTCTNAVKCEENSDGIDLYEWGVQTIYDLLVAPFPYQSTAFQVDKTEIEEKIRQTEKRQNSSLSNKKGE